jgi:precorrin-6B C5,15-methyltransferase / cobalt-precorrin-6B C5,C15-methyltransferase
MKPWLTIIGVGDDGLANLPEATLAHLGRANLIIAPHRLLKTTDFAQAELRFWSAGFDETLALILERRDTPVCVIATGDPMHFGIGATLTRHIGAEEMLVIPSPSAFSLAAARLGWPLQDVDCVSLHGRSCDHLARYLSPNRRILALTSSHETVRDAAQILARCGYGQSQLTVLEHMGGASERRIELSVEQAASHTGSDFNTLAIACVAADDAPLLPLVAGLPDDAFVHDGQLTKREVRAASLAALAPYPSAILWDVGAGCGSISIEWMRGAKGTRAYAIEDSAVRREMIVTNAKALGVPDMKIIAGRAPEGLAGLPAPDAVFIGGGVSEPNVFETCFEALKPGGRLVANVVTVEGEARLFDIAQTWGGQLSRIAVSRAEPVGKFLAFKPMMPVTMLVIEKGIR